jgi:UDP-galactopyranose mutase
MSKLEPHPFGTGAFASLGDIVCFSHLRWDFVFQRPQHLLTRFARHTRVFYVEEPTFGDAGPFLDVSWRGDELHVVVPRLRRGTSAAEAVAIQKRLLAGLFARESVRDMIQWFYTPAALPLVSGPLPVAVVYDCMDELSAFRNASPDLVTLERALLDRADLVLTGGRSLYRAKSKLHSNVHEFPSSVDREHFVAARRPQVEPADQREIPTPRLGFYGVLDERLDLELVAGIAALRPEWHQVFLGPTAKIEQDELPAAPNIHYLGRKEYAELPAYLAGWQVAMLPFARNEATRFISPTKTPEYLAAGKPVVSTPIEDVVNPYGVLDLVAIADTPASFVAAVERALSDDPARRPRADAYLQQNSWDQTWSRISQELVSVIEKRDGAATLEPSSSRAPRRARLNGTIG